MPSFGFIEAAYATRGLAADCQDWVNLYIEKNSSGQGANHNTGYTSYNTPGKQLLCTLSDAPISCVEASKAFFYGSTVDLLFVMSGATLYAIRATLAAGVWTGTSAVIGTGFPSQAINGTGGQLFPTQIIVINPTLLFVVAVGNAYVAAYGSAISASSLNNGGAGYAVGDTGIVPINGIPAAYIITGVAAGVVTGYTLTYAGTGYTVAAGVATQTGGAQPGIGGGFAINVTGIAAAAWSVQQQTIPEGSVGNYVNSATWMDGYVIVSMAPNSLDPLRREFFISGLYQPTVWRALDFDTKEANSDPCVRVFAANELLTIFGSQQVELWQDAGNVLSAFARLPGGGVLEYGLAQAQAVCKIGNTIAWLDSNARGQYVARMMQGNQPVRISNHALENTWSNYDTAGMSMYSYVENGHEFLCIHFPIPDKTYVWDKMIGPDLGWHRRMYWDGSSEHADLGRYHAFFPEIGHVVGDYRNGNLYLQSLQFTQDNCSNIVRRRVAPHLVAEKRRVVYDRVKLHCLTGRVPATGPGSAPVCSLYISNDGGQTYGNALTMPMGLIGETKKIIEWLHLGYSRDRVFKWECDEPIDIVLVDMYADFRPGFN